MISSWGEFLSAVERMRQGQKVYFLTRSPSALAAAKKLEAEVDACIEQRRAERARQLQPELL
jgi:hypothetical protein